MCKPRCSAPFGSAIPEHDCIKATPGLSAIDIDQFSRNAAVGRGDCPYTIDGSSRDSPNPTPPPKQTDLHVTGHNA
jgi:hypothetical protein